MKLKKTDKLEIVDRMLKVNGKTFIVQHPDEPLYCCTKDGKLGTLLIKGCGITCHKWEPEEIEGYFEDESNLKQ